MPSVSQSVRALNWTQKFICAKRNKKNLTIHTPLQKCINRQSEAEFNYIFYFIFTGWLNSQTIKRNHRRFKKVPTNFLVSQYNAKQKRYQPDTTRVRSALRQRTELQQSNTEILFTIRAWNNMCTKTSAGPLRIKHFLTRRIEKCRIIENRMLRRIFRLRTKEGTKSCRNLYNEEIHYSYCSPYMVKVIKWLTRWAEHVACVWEITVENISIREGPLPWLRHGQVCSSGTGEAKIVNTVMNFRVS
jgi:hypothetical protein